jgi:hypothetical protein
MCIALAGGALALVPWAANALTLGSTIAQGIAGQQAGDAQAKAKTLEANAALNASNIEAGRMRREGGAFLGQTRAVQAASGVDITTGSAADVGAESARNIEMDALTELYRGRLKAWGSNIEGSQAKAAGKAALTQSIASAGGTLLTKGIDDGWFKPARRDASGVRLGVGNYAKL